MTYPEDFTDETPTQGVHAEHHNAISAALNAGSQLQVITDADTAGFQIAKQVSFVSTSFIITDEENEAWVTEDVIVNDNGRLETVVGGLYQASYVFNFDYSDIPISGGTPWRLETLIAGQNGPCIYSCETESYDPDQFVRRFDTYLVLAAETEMTVSMVFGVPTGTSWGSPNPTVTFEIDLTRVA